MPDSGRFSPDFSRTMRYMSEQCRVRGSTLLPESIGTVGFTDEGELLIMAIHHEGGKQIPVEETDNPGTTQTVRAMGWISVDKPEGTVTLDLIDDGRVVVTENTEQPRIYFADSAVLTGLGLPG